MACRFSYDVNGLLEIDVQESATGEKRHLTVFDRDQEVSDADMRERREKLAALKVHPREADANRAALARATRCYEHFLGDQREEIGRMMSTFEVALDTQDPSTADRARVQFLSALDQLEGKSFL